MQQSGRLTNPVQDCFRHVSCAQKSDTNPASPNEFNTTTTPICLVHKFDHQHWDAETGIWDDEQLTGSKFRVLTWEAADVSKSLRLAAAVKGCTGNHQDTKDHENTYLYIPTCVCTLVCTHVNSINTLHYTTLHYITLHYTTLHYITLLYITLHYFTLLYITLHYSTLLYITLDYITLHCITFIHSYIHTV